MGLPMTFGVYLALATLAILLIRWVLFVIYEQGDNGPSFLAIMLDPNSYPRNARIGWVINVLFIGVAAFGLYAFQ
jgi:hypothetical protein